MNCIYFIERGTLFIAGDVLIVSKKVPISDTTPPAKNENLLAEFADLQEQQWKALDRAVYLGMTAIEAREYERRAERINALQRALGEQLTHHKDRPEKL